MIFAKQTYKKDICHVYGDYLPRIRKIFATLGRRSNTTLRILSVKGKGGGGGTPQIRNPLFVENFVRKGVGGFTPHIRNQFFGPKSFFFLAKNATFSPVRRNFFGDMSVKGGVGVTLLTDIIRKVVFERLPYMVYICHIYGTHGMDLPCILLPDQRNSEKHNTGWGSFSATHMKFCTH